MIVWHEFILDPDRPMHIAMPSKRPVELHTVKRNLRGLCQSLHAGLRAVGNVDRMLTYPLYSDLLLKADRCLGSLAGVPGIAQDYTIQSLHNWIEIKAEALRSPLLGDQPRISYGAVRISMANGEISARSPCKL
jgi:hypothetical protein